MNASQAAILERAAAAAVNGHRARPRAAAAAALRSCRRPAGLLLARRGLLLPRGLLLRLRLRAASAATSSGPLLLLGAAAASRPRSWEGAEGPSRLILRGWEVLRSLRGAPSPTSPLSLPLSAFNTTIIISDSRGGGGRARGRAPTKLSTQN